MTPLTSARFAKNIFIPTLNCTQQPMAAESHQSQQHFQCNRCSKCFSLLSKLLVHKKSHALKRPFKCDAQGCSYSFKTSQKLKIHMDNEHKSYAFSCSYCKVRFKESICFKLQHLEAHKTDTPGVFQCLYFGCRETFSDPSDLRSHMKQHQGIQKCNIPDCLFTSKTYLGLQMHRKSVHSIRLHYCRLCGKGFDNSYRLKLHMKRHTTMGSQRSHQMHQ